MIPLRSDINTLVRSLLGDTQIAAGQLYTDSFLPPFLNAAYQELFSRLSVTGVERVQREGYYVLPAYTSYFAPASAGLNNFDHPIDIWERGTPLTADLSNCQTSNPAPGRCLVTVTAVPAGVATGQQVQLYNVGGVSDDVNDNWTVELLGPTQVVLNGNVSTGTYTGGGVLVYSKEDWVGPLIPLDSTDYFPNNSVNSMLEMYVWQKGIIKFPVCGYAREIKINYELSGSLSVPGNTSDSTGIDDSLNFLAHRTAQLAGAAKGSGMAAMLMKQADYFLGIFLAGAARDMQSDQPIVPPNFREKRNIRPFTW